MNQRLAGADASTEAMSVSDAAVFGSSSRSTEATVNSAANGSGSGSAWLPQARSTAFDVPVTDLESEIESGGAGLCERLAAFTVISQSGRGERENEEGKNQQRNESFGHHQVSYRVPRVSEVDDGVPSGRKDRDIS